MLSATVLAGLLMAASPAAASVDRKTIGFGAKRVKGNKHLLASPTTCANVEQYWYKDAVVDNFAAAEEIQHWAGEGQRYWLNKQFWAGPGAPIFVFIGGEGQESCSRLTSKMYLYDLAQQHNALLMNVEHRYYGESYPTADMSTANLSKYLSSQQALADLSRIITHVKGDLNTAASKVITVGGSYPGNMAAWFRLKYPSVTHGSLASSAPLNAQTNFPEYMEVVSQSLTYFGGQACVDNIEAAADVVASMYEQGPSSASWSQLNADFKTCSPMATKKDLQVLLSDLMGNFQGTIQYNNEHNGVLNATDVCAVMTADGTPYDNFVKMSALYREQNDVECEDASWADMLTWLAAPEKDPNNAGRPWTFQTCNEFGYFQTTDSPHQPFHSWKPLNLEFYMDMCAAGFDGWSTEPQVEFMNQVYGSRAIDATNVIFAAGTVDPWHALGITNYTGSVAQPTEHPVYILGTAHCNDLYAPASTDPESLVVAREVIANQIAQWVN